VIEAEHIFPEKAFRRCVRVSLGFQRFFQMFTSLREKMRTDPDIRNLSCLARAIAPTLSASSTCQNLLEIER
jgi:hypothetical protein